MTFKKRTSLSTLSDSKWMEWAIQRTGIPMPNCVTYATARISEILNRREYLDDPRINGAQELWTHYSQGFHQSRYAQPGALMIWSYGRYGHVAVCEELIATDTITWSQSNYGGAMFEYVKGNPNGYKGMQFLGYLIHDELLKNQQTASASPAPAIKPGKKVRIKDTATTYASGEHIPSWVKSKSFTVSQVSKNKALLKEILSWVRLSDLQIQKTQSTGLQIGNRVHIKRPATVYASGQHIPSWVKEQTYTIQQIKADRVLLKEIQSWVLLQDIE